MSNYRRLFIPGGTYFFTAALADRAAQTLVNEIDLLRACYRAMQKDHPILCHAMVVLPDHIHAVWTLPAGDSDFPARWKILKSSFSQHCRSKPNPRASHLRKGEKGIWQRRFWEHAIRDQQDFNDHLHYCWTNPVKHGYVTRAEDWPFSSLHRDARGNQRSTQM